MSKTKYDFSGFFMLKISGERFISALVENGFTVEPGLSNHKIYYQGNVSCIISLWLHHASSDLQTIHSLIVSIINNRSIPNYGFYLKDLGAGNGKYFGGFMPIIEEEKQTPYRGNVIPIKS